MTSPSRSARRSSRCPRRRGRRRSARTARTATGLGGAEITERLDLTTLARRHARDRAPRTPPPRRATQLHRSRWPPLPGHLDRPCGRPGRARAPAPRPRQRRGPHPRRQADRAREPPLPRLRSQRDLARAVADRPGPHRLDPAPDARRRARRLRTEDAALPAAAHRRTPGLPRPPRAAAPATHLTVGAPTGRRLRPPRSAAAAALTRPAPATDDDRAAALRRPRPRPTRPPTPSRARPNA